MSEDQSPVDPDGPPGESTTLVGLLNVFLTRGRLFLLVPALFVLVAVTWHVLQPDHFSSDSTFVPELVQAGASSRLAGLAQQFGLDAGSTAGTESLQFWSELVTSRSLLEDVARRSYPTREGGEEDLATLFEIESRNAEARLRRAVGELRRRIRVTSKTTTGMITLEVTAEDPELAVALNREVLDRVSRYGIERRQSRAAQERTFIEERMSEAQDSLRRAEQELETFLNQNRSIQSSPSLSAEMNRLQRNVSLRQQLYTSLATSYEQARINEVRSTPVITVMESPEGWAQHEDDDWVRTVLLAAFLGLFVAAAVALAQHYVDLERRANPEEYRRMRDNVRAAAGTLNPKRFLASSGRRGE